MKTPSWFDKYLEVRRDRLTVLHFGVLVGSVIGEISDPRAVRSAAVKLVRGEYVDDNRLRALEEASGYTFDNTRAEPLEREFAAAVLLMLAATGWSERESRGPLHIKEPLTQLLADADPETHEIWMAAAQDLAGLA